MNTLIQLEEYLKKNPEVVGSLNAAKSVEEVNAILKQNGFDLTLDEIKQMEQDLAQDRDLSDEELEAVAGGCFCIGIGFGTTDGHQIITSDGFIWSADCDGIGIGIGNVPT